MIEGWEKARGSERGKEIWEGEYKERMREEREREEKESERSRGT